MSFLCFLGSTFCGSRVHFVVAKNLSDFLDFQHLEIADGRAKLVKLVFFKQWRSQNFKKLCTSNQAVILFNCVPFHNGNFS